MRLFRFSSSESLTLMGSDDIFIIYKILSFKLKKRIPEGNGGMEDMEGESQFPDRKSSSSFLYLVFIETENNVPYVP